MSSWKRMSILVSMFGVLALTVASSSQAGQTSMYNFGTLSIKAFGNDTTTGSTYPSNTNVYLGHPFGQHCNSARGTGTTVCGGTYPSAQAGSPLIGGNVVNVTTGAYPAKFALPQSELARKLGTIATSWATGPFTTYTRTSAGGQGSNTVYNSNPNHVARPLNGVPGGSFSYYPPYIYSYSYADLKNQAGNFFGGGGPGNFTYQYSNGGTPVATAKVTQGANKFGGTMALLGSFRSREGYFINGGLSVGTLPWLFQAVGGNGGGNHNTTAYTLTGSGTGMHTVLTGTFTEAVKAMAFPWTTGVAAVDAVRGPFSTHMKRTGYDSRTAGGVGNIQMVSPMLTHWDDPVQGVNMETGGIGVMKLKFVPEPSSMLLLGAGISLLGLAYRSTRRS